MKKIMVLPGILAISLLLGCDPVATFDRPQPARGGQLVAFPARLQGRYLAEDKASVLVVTGHAVVRVYDFDYKEHKDSLGASFKIEGDTLTDLERNHKEQILMVRDSVLRHAHWADSLFAIAGGNMLKKYKGHYFLNSRYSDSLWGVQRLSLEKGVLVLGIISGKDDIQKLRQITETNDDTLSTHFILTHKQFKKFLKEDGFEAQEVFVRIPE